MGATQQLIFANIASNAYTDRVQAFVDAGLSDQTIIDALNTFDNGLISYGLDTLIVALYPYVGGDATKHSWNFMDINSFQTTWYGGVTHNSNGITGNGTNAYGDTGLIPNTDLIQNDVHVSVYCRSNVTETACDIGVGDSSNVKGLEIWTRYAGDTYVGLNDDTWNYSVARADGFTFGSRNASNSNIIYKNGSQLSSDTKSSTGKTTKNLYVLALNYNSGAAFFSSKNISFVSVGKSMNSTEQSNYYNLVQQLQTDLSRQV